MEKGGHHVGARPRKRLLAVINVAHHALCQKVLALDESERPEFSVLPVR
jgi:hypothetical protein